LEELPEVALRKGGHLKTSKGGYLHSEKDLKRAIGSPNIKRKNHTTHIVCLSTETFPLTVVGKLVNYLVPRGFL
jgi:hypothetical protein